MVLESLKVLRDYRLDPRDSIHVASVFSERADTIISSDKHFGRIKELRRRDL